MRKTLRTLNKEYQVEDFFVYICDTWHNGHKKHCIELFRKMTGKDRQDFMIELNNCTFHQWDDGPWQVEMLDYIIRNSTII